MSEEKKRKKRWSPGFKRMTPKPPERLPYYKENPPKYEPAREPARAAAQVPKKCSTAKLIAALIVVIVTTAIVFTFTFMFIFGDESLSWNQGGNSGISDGSGGVRNCVKSVMHDYPSCSDDDRTVKDTYLNGRYVGTCHYIDNAGNCY